MGSKFIMRKMWTLEKLKDAILKSKSQSETLRNLNVPTQGGYYRLLRKDIEDNDISTKHWKKEYKKSESVIDEFFIDGNNTIDGRTLKKNIVRLGLFSYKCSWCNISEWRGKDLVLHLDHINGNNRDNRLENLRFLCPNCHSQTPTYCGSKLKKINKCIDCNIAIHKSAKRCKSCFGIYSFKSRKTKICWPTAQELENLVSNKPLVQVGKELGVTCNAVRKRCKKLGINWKNKRSNGSTQI